MKHITGVLLLLVFETASAQIPPGFELVYLSTGRPVHRDVAINSQGHLITAAREVPLAPQSSDLFFYDGTAFTQLTNDDVTDAMPSINDLDEIVWCRAIGVGDTFEVMRMREWNTDQITTNSVSEFTPQINGAGQIVWNDWPRTGCSNSVASIFLYDDQQGIRTIISDGVSNQGPVINERGDIAWTRYDYCRSPWTSEILALIDGQMQVLTTDQREPQVPGISDNGRVAWYCYTPPPPGEDSIQIWNDGETTTLTGWGSGLRMNGRGDIAFDRWYDSNQTWQVHLYLNGQFYQITNGAAWSYVAGINDLGEVVFITGNPPYNTQIGLLRRVHAPTLPRTMDFHDGGAKRAGFGG